MNTSRITKKQSSYSTSMYVYLYICVLGLRSIGGPVGEEYPPSRTDLLHGLDVRFSAGKKQDSGDSEQGKHVETAWFGYFFDDFVPNSFMSILC